MKLIKKKLATLLMLAVLATPILSNVTPHEQETQEPGISTCSTSSHPKDETISRDETIFEDDDISIMY